MDIDEFLDREISDLNISSDSTEKSETSQDSSKDGIDKSALFQSVKSSLGTADLDKAERAYSGLWAGLMQQGLKWNKDIYDQISAISRRFSGMLSQSYDEMKKKADNVYELINKARNAMQDGKNDLAYKIYFDVQGISSTMPNVFFEEKRYVQDQILSLYRDLNNNTDGELIKKVSVMMQEINALIGKMNSSLNSNNVAAATADYSKCIELYSQVPQGFLRTKNIAGMKLLEIYRSLSIYLEISMLQNQLGQQQLQLQQAAPKAPFAPNASGNYYQQQAPAARKYEKTGRYVRLNAKPRAARNRPLKPAAEENAAQKTPAPEITSSMTADKKRENAKKNIKKGFYNEAWKDIEEALQADPSDVESKALRAKIKTLQ